MPRDQTLFRESGLEHLDVLFHLANEGDGPIELDIAFENWTGTSAAKWVTVTFFTPAGLNQSERRAAGGPLDWGVGSGGDRRTLNVWANDQGLDAGPNDHSLFGLLTGELERALHSTTVPTGEYFMVVGLERARADIRITGRGTDALVFEEVLRDPGIVSFATSLNHEDWEETMVVQGPLSGASMASTRLGFDASFRYVWAGVSGYVATLEFVTEADSCRSVFPLAAMVTAADFSDDEVQLSYIAAKGPVPASTLVATVIALNVPLPEYTPGEPYVRCAHL